MGALHDRAKKGDLAEVKLMYQTARQPDIRDNHDNTPLHMAARRGNVDVVYFLLSVGANPNAQNAVGDSPLILATMGGHVQVVEILLENGADVQLYNDHGNSPLHFACFFRHLELAEKYLELGLLWCAENMHGGKPALRTSPWLSDSLAAKAKALKQKSETNRKNVPRTHADAAEASRNRFIAQGGTVWQIGHLVFQTFEVKKRTHTAITKLGRYLDFQIVVKKPFNQTYGPADIKLLTKELEVIKTCVHPNLHSFLGACLDIPNVSIVTEQLPKSLKTLIHDPSVTLSQEQIMNFVMDIVRGMEYLHTHSPAVCHFNLKGSNVLINARNRAQLTEFGFHAPPFNFVHGSTFIYEPANVAPELLQYAEPPGSHSEPTGSSRNLAALDKGSKEGLAEGPADLHKSQNIFVSASTMSFYMPCDVYAFGILLYEIVTRQLPYNRAWNPMVLGMKVLTDDARPIIPSYVPKGLATLMADCWSSDPSLRPNFSDILGML